MVRTLGNQGKGASSQAPPTPPAPPPPSPKIALILCSLEAINETLKGHQPAGIEVEPPPSGTVIQKHRGIQGEDLHPKTSLENCKRSNFWSSPGVAPVNAQKHGWKA